MTSLDISADRGIAGLLGGAVERGEMSGVVAAATDREGVIASASCGVQTSGGGVLVTLDTVFSIESMTKAFTAVACLQAVERGLVSLDQDLGSILSALAAPMVLEGFDDGRPILRTAKAPVTLRRLLTHTAGAAYEMWNTRIRDYVTFTGIPRAATFRRPDSPLPLVTDPGTRWEYGVGMEWAGTVLEALTGKSIDALFHDDIFAPLGMTSTGYAVGPDMRARLATTHQREADGTLTPHTDIVPDVPDHIHGGGGSFSTANDYLRFLRMLLNDGTLDGVTVIQPSSVATFRTPAIEPLPVEPMRTALPRISHDFDPLPGIRTDWGLGFAINHDPLPGRRSAGSYAWAGLRNTYYWVDPTTGVAGLLLTGILPFGDPTTLDLFAAFERQVYAQVLGTSAR